jgi:hypothetical protein
MVQDIYIHEQEVMPSFEPNYAGDPKTAERTDVLITTWLSRNLAA